MRWWLIVPCLMGLARADVSAPALAPATKPVRWLTGRDGLPAASATRGAIREPDAERACAWVKVGTRWRMLDDAGKSIGITRVTRLEDDEVWPCKMATFAGGRRGARLLVEAAAAPAPAPTRTWTPDAGARAALHALVDRRGEAFYFEIGAERFAATTGGSAVIARWSDAGWQIEWRSPKDEAHWRTPAAIDVDGDGVPEVVLQQWEDTDYRDVILTRVGRFWRLAAVSFDGNTI